MHIHLWSSPRNISTALMYAFAQRPDMNVVDEPLYAHYLLHQKTTALHPGKKEILAAMETDQNLLVRQLTADEYDREHVVFKQMTHHLEGFSLANEVAMLGLNSKETGKEMNIKNVLLIRDPRAILASFSKVVKEVTAEDIGLPQQYELFQKLDRAGKLTAVLDARRLLLDPGEVLKKLCSKLGIHFFETMLSWPAGPIPEDGIWAKYWYGNVHKSTGFKAYQEKEIHLRPDLEKIAVQLEDFYQVMLAKAL